MTRGDCESIRPLLSAALDGELDEDQFVELSEHLATCDDCHQAYQDYSSLRDELRSSSTPVPPSDLTRSIRQETIEKPPPPLVIRLASRAGLKFGATTVAASLVLLFAFGIFGYIGHDRNTPPAIAASSPVQETGIVEDWPVHQPVEIEFSKRMNKQSVKQHLMIRPSSELDRLPRDWDGNTLVIGRSEDHSVLLRPRTDYTIAVMEQAEDRHGNPLGESFVLRFRTSPQEVAVSTPRAEDDNTETGETPTQENTDPSPSQEESATPTTDNAGDGGGANDAVGGDDVDESDVRESESEPEPTATSREQDEQETTEEGDQTADEDDQNQSQNQPGQQEDEEDTPESTATPKPTPTPSPKPEPTATPETPESDETEEPTAPATAASDEDESETIPVRGPFGEIYWGNQSVQDALGQPIREATSFIAAEQEFQRGLMFRLYHREQNAIFVFVSGGNVETYPLNYDPETDDYPGAEAGSGLYEPSAYFGKVWAEQEGIAEALGNAISQHPDENVDAAMQQFTNGQMIYSRGMVYVVYQDWTWDAFPAQSGDSGDFQHSPGDDEQPADGDDSQPDGDAGSGDAPETDEDIQSGETPQAEDEAELQSTPDDTDTTPETTPDETDSAP